MGGGEGKIQTLLRMKISKWNPYETDINSLAQC